jgi:peptidoglycan/LPS O-acetylase OafA/YrhL
VLGAHCGWIQQSAGAVGVAIFFTLSGFLITRVIIEARAEGTWSLPRFYGNRAARLAPALIVVVTATTLGWLASGRPAEHVWTFAPALLYVQNFAHPWLDGQVLAHTWSLAVEEQFYLLWPAALIVLLRRPRVIGPVLMTTVALSVILRLALADGHTAVAYASLPTNAFGMLLGAYVALIPPRLGRSHGWPLPVLTVLALLPISPMTGPVAAAGLTALLLAQRNRAERLLALSPLRFAGRISYALYLWHWPVLWFTGTTYAGFAALPPAAASVGLAIASTFLLEEPIRAWWRSRSLRAPVLNPEHDGVRASREDGLVPR